MKNTALLIMDVQNATITRLKDEKAYLDRLSNVIKIARENQLYVIYVVVGFREGFPEVSKNNKSFSTLKNGAMQMDKKESVEIPMSVSPLPEDILITKRRVSAFTGSDLEVVLRSLEVKHIILTGISTSGVVLSTLREAADKDYQISVISDCCADLDNEVQRVLTTKVFPRQAEVISSTELKDFLKKE